MSTFTSTTGFKPTLPSRDKPASFILPDLMSMCPLDPTMNPHYLSAGTESRAWIDSYDVHSEQKLAAVGKTLPELLAARAYPYADYEQYRICCDFLYVLFFSDEITDGQSGSDAHATMGAFLKAFQDPDYVYESSDKIYKITRDFTKRLFTGANPQTYKRIINAYIDYATCVGMEAQLREQGNVPTLESFIPLRRKSSAVPLSFSLFEYALGINLPDIVFEIPTFMEMYFAAVDMVCWSNDLLSYKVEVANGLEGSNVVTVLMKEKEMSLQAACEYVGEQIKVLMDKYLAMRECLFADPEAQNTWGPDVHAGVKKYVEAAGYWVRGNLDWSFETSRYFGAEAEEVRRTRLVTL